MSWIISFLIVVVIFLCINYLNFFKKFVDKRWWLNAAMALKIVASIFLVWLYTNYYPNRTEADIYKYFDDALILNELLETEAFAYVKLITGIGDIGPEGRAVIAKTAYWDKSPSVSFLNDNRLIIRFNAIVALVSLGNIYSHMFLASFISFIGFLWIYKSFLSDNDFKNQLFFIVLFTLPSFVLWTSGVLKEALMIFALGGLIHILRLIEKDGMKWQRRLLIIIFGWMLALTKIYILLLLFPLVIAYYWNERQQDSKTIWRYLVVILLFSGMALNFKFIHPRLDVVQILINKQYEFKCLAEWIGAGSAVYVPDIQYSIWSFAKASPHALYNALLRPGPLDVHNPFMLLSFIEVIGIWGFFFACLWFRKNQTNNNFILFCVLFILSFALLIGYTTPVLGAIVRYRIPNILFMLIIGLHLLDEQFLIYLKIKWLKT